ncbi:MAG: aspartate aminotransferase [Fimbriimonadales bacterium]
MLSERVNAIHASPTLALTARVAELRRNGADVIAFGVGEPDFPTPEPIGQAGIQAIRDGHTRYTPSAGTMTLRKAVAEKLLRENKVRYDPHEVVISCGAKHAMFNALLALCNPGDEVLLPCPYWPTYVEQVRLCGAVPVEVPCHEEDGYLPSYDALRQRVSYRTKAIIVNTPNNPTGAVWPRTVLKEIAAIALKHDCWIIADEIYERLVYENEEHVSIASLSRQVWERTVTVGGVSKTYAMTGWRIGYAAAPREVAEAMSKLQDQMTSNPSSISMRAAEAAVAMPVEDLEHMREEYAERREILYHGLTECPGVNCQRTKGAFFLFPSVHGVLGGCFGSTVELAEYLLDQAGCAVLPGEAFGAPGHLRLSYALSKQDIQRGVRRLKEAFAMLSP